MNFQPTVEEVESIKVALAKFNEQVAEAENHNELNIIEYDEKGSIVAGLLGGTYWGWLYISYLWVEEQHRKKGLGSKLVDAAEVEGLKRGCAFAHLDTMSFQALGFYRKMGYKV